MARRKQVSPMQRINSGEIMQSPSDTPEKPASYTSPHTNGHVARSAHQKVISATSALKQTQHTRPKAGILQLLICVGGIYASFLTWGLLQERITTTPYSNTSSIFPDNTSRLPPPSSPEYWRFPIALNCVQALFASLSGTLYLLFTHPRSTPLLPSKSALPPLLMVAFTSTLASPFGYTALSHVDYLTFVLAKSCKLLPVMALHIILYQKRYALSKYAIVLAVTAGVAVFTIYHPPKAGKSRGPAKSSSYGLLLLGVNLLFDGLTNTTQDRIFSSPGRYGRLTSAQMMAITNLFSSLLMAAYLILTPFIPHEMLPPFAKSTSTNELSAAVAFLQRHPSVANHVLLFALAGGIGQLFIFATLERFSSLLLVTVTVTRKMLTMVLSVVWYGKSLSGGQWAGVGLVFGGIGTEALLAAKEKRVKEKLHVEGKKMR